MLKIRISEKKTPENSEEIWDPAEEKQGPVSCIQAFRLCQLIMVTGHLELIDNHL